MSLSGLVIYKTNFFRQLWDNPEVNSFFLNIALGCTGFLISVLLYMSIYGPCFLKREIDLEVDLPQLIPVMSIAGCAVFISGILAVWPLWGLLTPIYFLILFFGSSFSMIFLPSGNLGNFLFWVIAAGGGYVCHNLEHEPVW